MAKKKKDRFHLRCPYCGRGALLKDASYVYGDSTLHPEGYLYVCSGYPEKCDAYVGAHRHDLRPMGTLADGDLRHLRIQAHQAMDAVWKPGYMTKHGLYLWLSYRLNLRKQDMHIGRFSDYYCKETIRECRALLEACQKQGKGGNDKVWRELEKMEARKGRGNVDQGERRRRF